MSIATARHFLNGVDVFETYGLVVSGGSASFLAKPRRKDPLSWNWPDENGVQRDLSAPRFEDTQAVLDCAFVADNDTDLKTKSTAFYAALTAPGLQQWRVSDHSETYKVFYVSEANKRKPLGRLKNATKAVLQFSLTLGVSSSENDISSDGNGLPVTIYNSNGTVWKILEGGESATLPDVSPRTETFYGRNLEGLKTIYLPVEWVHQEGDIYQVVVSGFPQPPTMWSFTNASHQAILLDEEVYPYSTIQVIKYPKA